MKRRTFLKIAAASFAAIAAYGYAKDEKMKKAPKLKGKILADLHAHPSANNADRDLAEMLTGNIIGLAERCGNKAILSYDKALQLPNTKQIDLGLFAEIINENGEKGYFLKAQEIEADYHVLALGCFYSLPNFKDARKAVEEVHKQEGIAILCHPYSRPKDGAIPYRLGNEKDEKKIKELCEMVDEIEVFNAQNINPTFGIIVPNMKKANKMAEQAAKAYGFNGIASSDAHYAIEQCGIAGIYIPVKDAKELCFDAIKEHIKKGNFERYENYVSRLSFIKGMFFSK